MPIQHLLKVRRFAKEAASFPRVKPIPLQQLTNGARSATRECSGT